MLCLSSQVQVALVILLKRHQSLLQRRYRRDNGTERLSNFQWSSVQ